MDKIWTFIIDILIAIMILFVSVAVFFGFRTESVIKSLGTDIVNDFAGEIKKDGYLTVDDYETYIEKLSITDALFDITLEHKYSMSEPEYRFRTIEEIIAAQNAAYTGENIYHYREIVTLQPEVTDPIDHSGLVMNTETNESVLASAISIPSTGHIHTSTCYLTGTYTFSTVGCHEFIAPASGNYTFEVWGAQGGGNNGGWGGYSKGDFTLMAGEKVFVRVGGRGIQGTSSFATWNGGAFNGGGGFYGTLEQGSGGGATDIRVKGQALTDRVIVAGGGGGQGDTRYFSRYEYIGYSYAGGPGGGYEGGNTWFKDKYYTEYWSYGGGQSASTYTGALGDGGYGYHNGGGGGGYYGGGTNFYGPYGTASGGYVGGAGGSGYIGGVLNGTMASGIRSGDGYAVIGINDTICNKKVVSIIPTHPIQNVFVGEALITTATATYADGSTNVVVCTTDFSTASSVNSAAAVLTYIDALGNTLTANITVTVVAYTKTCVNGHTYNIRNDGTDPGCPYCFAWVENLRLLYPTTSTMIFTIGTTLEENGIKLLATYYDGHMETITNGYVDNLDNDYFGTMLVTIGYKGATTQLMVTTVCRKMICDICSYEYNLYPDGTNPGCPRCISKTPVFTGNVLDYEDVFYTDTILEKLYKDRVYKFDKNDTFTVIVKNRSTTLARNILNKIYPSLSERWFNVKKSVEIKAK